MLAPLRFDIHDAEWGLIDAALALGDRLAALPETTAEQRAAIGRVQGALRRLPEVEVGVNGSYGFDATEEAVLAWFDGGDPDARPVPEGVVRDFFVDLHTDRGGRVTLEIGNLWLPSPEHAEGRLAGLPYGFDAYFVAGVERSGAWTYTPEQWADVARDPGRFRRPDVRLEVEAEWRAG